MKNKKSADLQYEKNRDTADRFIAERYISYGFYMHFHRNIELYYVCKGKVNVTINGDARSLSSGQMAVISSLESHSYEAHPSADITYLHIGMNYIAPFVKVYGAKRPARWLTDTAYNTSKISPLIKTILKEGTEMTELEKICYANLLLASIVNQYGFNEEKDKIRGGGISEIIQYIYDNSDSDLNLEILADKFGYVPQVLSRKISACIDVDLRVFINDVRAQKVMMMRNDERYKDYSLMEIASRCGFNSVATFYRSYNRNFRRNDKPGN